MKVKMTVLCTGAACKMNMCILDCMACLVVVLKAHTHSEEITSTHQCTHFSAMEYLLVPDSLSLTRKLASLQRCS